MKLGWIVVGGGTGREEAGARLETLCDTFLSVNTPAQVALPRLLGEGTRVREALRRRCVANYRTLREVLAETSCTPLEAEGGWYGIIRMPKTRTDEEWAIALLEERGIYLFPGYFFDFDEGYLVVSLLPEEEVFRGALEQLRDYVAS
jgi:aspartate/methionine/tyrosine aminotransferase